MMEVKEKEAAEGEEQKMRPTHRRLEQGQVVTKKEFSAHAPRWHAIFHFFTKKSGEHSKKLYP